MLALTVTPEGPALVITHASPMPYLDHWAFRKFSGDAGLGARLTAALRARGGRGPTASKSQREGRPRATGRAQYALTSGLDPKIPGLLVSHDS